jgi:hypothetical protein
MKLRKGGFLIYKIQQLQGKIFTKILKANGIDDLNLNSSQGRIFLFFHRKMGYLSMKLLKELL